MRTSRTQAANNFDSRAELLTSGLVGIGGNEMVMFDVDSSELDQLTKGLGRVDTWLEPGTHTWWASLPDQTISAAGPTRTAAVQNAVHALRALDF